MWAAADCRIGGHLTVHACKRPVSFRYTGSMLLAFEYSILSMPFTDFAPKRVTVTTHMYKTGSVPRMGDEDLKWYRDRRMLC